MSTTKPQIEPITWKGDMCFGIISTKAHTTVLTASSDALVLEGPFGKIFHLPFTRVKSVETDKSSVWFLRGLGTGSIQINHDIEHIPKLLLFSAADDRATDVAQELQRLGYVVAA